jgi:N-acetylglucosaminyldiphosphoundecaprenol N-acetyl-beta-D-mannosaminyltransferase
LASETSSVRRCSVLGTTFYAGTLSSAADLVIDQALSGAGGYATQTGLHGVTSAPRDPELRLALDASWMNFPDGKPVVWRQRRQHRLRDVERCGGPDLMELVIDRGRLAGLRHFFYGSTEMVLAGLRTRLAALYPGAIIAGTFSPPFHPPSETDERAHYAIITESEPHVVWVGLGAPKQDLWCHRNADGVAPALCIGVGAAFDFLSGAKARAPRWMQRSGLEWVHRLVGNPRTLGPRYLRAGSLFVALSVEERMSGSKERVG